MPSGEPAHFNALADDEPRPPPPGLSEAEYRRWEKTENKRLADAKKEKEKVEKLDQARRQKWEKDEAAKAKAEERKREKAENAEENKKKQAERKEQNAAKAAENAEKRAAQNEERKKKNAEAKEAAKTQVSGMQAFNYKLSLATTKAKLGMDIYRLNQLIKKKQRVLGPSVYELLSVGPEKHKEVEALFLECKKAVDEAIHQMDEKTKDLNSLNTTGECNTTVTIKKPVPPAEAGN